MKTSLRHLLTLTLPLLAMLCAGAVSHSRAQGDTLAVQRALFLQTRAQLQVQKNRVEPDAATLQTMAELKNYPLYPYLQQQQLSALIELGLPSEAAATQIDEFITQHEGSVAGEQLRSQWLGALAANSQWKQFLYYYRPASAGKSQQCEFIDALHYTGQLEAALQETDKIWLNIDMPDACDAAYARWLASDRRSEAAVWKRLQLALDKNQEALARTLAAQIAAPYKQQAENALLLLRQPAALADVLTQVAQHPEASATIAFALKNLARRDVESAQALWLQARAAALLTPADSDAVRQALGRQYIVRNGADALPWLLQYDAEGSDSYLLEWRLRFALGAGDWEKLSQWTTQLPADLAQTSRWNYWRARALQQQNDSAAQQQAAEIFTKLAKERGYYGFLAADQLKAPYALNDEPITSGIDSAVVERQPAVMRAREFFQLGEVANARREWQSALRAMSVAEQRAAALLAARWGWHDQTIRSAAQSGGFNDVRLRFPMAYHDSMQAAAKKTQLPLQWLFAITRQESAFMSDARSPVGALGLMQLMPTTAQQVARGERVQIDNQQLLQPDMNIRLGSAYLRDLARRFNGNRILATAAYNAGPNRISTLLREQSRALSADVWIELLPYRETREYVQSVLTFSVIYSQRLGKPTPLLNQSEREIGAPELRVGNADAVPQGSGAL